MDKKETCVLCGTSIEGWGNNAQPLSDGRACDTCNDTKVIPARLEKGVKREV